MTEAPRNKSVRIVSFLGLGYNGKDLKHNERGQPLYYQEASYELIKDTPSDPTQLHDVATIQAYGPENVTALILIGTQQTKDRWFGNDKLFETLLQEANATVPVAFILIPDGSNDTERWQIFTDVCKYLDPEPITQLPEHTSPSEIVVDITHGFRSQPFFAASAISYMQSQQRRAMIQSHKPQPTIRILYAAFEKRVKDANQRDITPVWDLSQFLEVLAWDSAIDGLMRYGRADDLQVLLKSHHNAIAKAPRPAGQPFVSPNLEGFGKSSKKFADGLVTARVPTLITELSDELNRTIGYAQPNIEQRIPPLKQQLNKLQNWADKLHTSQPISQKGILATLEIAKIYLETERYSELSALLRENIISAWTLLHEPGEIYQPGDQNLKAQRMFHEHTIGRKAAFNDFSHPLTKLFSGIRDIRNDIQHAGFNPKPTPAQNLRNLLVGRLNEQTQVFTELIENGAFEIPIPQTTKTGFLNCSNHPIDTWSQSQKDAALALGFGDIIELPGGFPKVAPQATTGDVQQLANNLVEQIIALNPGAVFIAGEFSLTYAAVSLLKAGQIPCFTASSERVSEQSLQPDGSVKTIATFQFAGWRSYFTSGEKDETED